MSTYGQAMLSEIDKSLLLLNQYIIDGCEEIDIKSLLSRIAASTEIFLKRDVFPGKNNGDNFYSFIEQLKIHSINKIRIDAIHSIRKAYNDAKHDPNSIISAIKVKGLFDDLRLAVKDILISNIGRVNASIRSATSRIFWICAWDHYTSGETEVTIFLPSVYDGFLGAHSVDHVSIDGMKWDEFKAELPNFGSVYRHEGLIPDGQVKFWFSESDCLTPFVFEGEYSSLIICLSKYLKDVDLIPGLAREDDPVNLLQTAAMVVIDVYVNDPTEKKEIQYLNALSLASNKYAVLRKFSNRIEPFIKKIIDVIDQLPYYRKSVLSGPIWIAKDTYESDQSEYRNDSIFTLVDSKNRIALGVRVR